MRKTISLETIPSSARMGESINLTYNHPYLVDCDRNLRCKLPPRVSRFVKILINHYPNTVPLKEILTILDPLNLWRDTNGLRQIANQARAALEAFGCIITFEAITNFGYRLLIPIQIVGPEANIIIPPDAVETFKHILSTHADAESVQDFVNKLGIRF